METKEQLQKKLNAIIKAEENKIIEENYPVFKERFEGKFFKTRNSYSIPKKPSDYWWLYTKVTKISPSDIYNTGGNGVASNFTGYAFQTDKYGSISINKEKRGYISSLGQEISEKEFIDAWNKMVSNLNSLS